MEGWLWITVALMFMGLILVSEGSRKRLSMQFKVMKWPAGPRKFPIIGNLHQLNNGGELVHINLAKLARKHGRMMTIWFGSWEPTIVVSDHDLAWEVLVSKAPDFSSRTLPYMTKLTTADWNTLSSSNLGSFWDNLRKGLHLTALNPKTILEQTILQEEDVSKMLLSLHEEASSNNGVVKPLRHIRRIIIQLIGRLSFGAQFKDDIFVNGIDNAIEKTIELTTGHARLANLFEFSRHIPGLNRPFKKASEVKRIIEELIRPYVTSQRFTSSPRSRNSYLHFLLSQNFLEEIIIFNLFELFMFAVDSTSFAIAWSLAFLIHDQQIQQKLYKEVRGAAVKVEKVNKLQYLQAVMKETMRMKPIAPLAVPHRAVRDSTLMGTKIVTGTPILVNLYAVQHDPKIWVEPYQFMPERFLASSFVIGEGCKDSVSPSESMERSFLPFGAGRRTCAGMELAKSQVGFTIASLVNRFHWSSVVESELPDISEDFTFLLRMKTPLVARIVSRS